MRAQHRINTRTLFHKEDWLIRLIELHTNKRMNAMIEQPGACNGCWHKNDMKRKERTNHEPSELV